ncbi:SycD/LcrH family type III secretion system chaperone [Pseudoalteromonas sp. MMG024]|uniref:SycD/LcrH family type III secretion system chaperone n=1 Tax=Pseudoalteromonas sp. MMG024 TaxID=2909980 RepID=UPI001F3AC234|nr:SycD/LcrH family type III secretion system chaperone [Pseudoalteromonas sp. MMG024]MCF6455659.1 SycD/LcrH family type III secretion system chaperone [Pseudoalteromonas sp. MMG024]
MAQIDPSLVKKEQLETFIGKGGLMHELVDLSKEQMESLYAVAFNLYQTNRMSEAEQVFKMLVLCDHLNVKYQIGLGATRQAQGKYEEAAETYSMATLIDAEEPKLAFHSGECHLALGDLERAEAGFTGTLVRCEGRDEYSELATKAQGLLSIVEKRKKKQEQTDVSK